MLFDFPALAQVEEPLAWVLAAAAACGTELDRIRATSLADRLLTAGRAGGPLPARVPPRLAELWADRDLYPHAHRGAYTGLAETVDTGIDGFADALYERVLVPEGWVPYPDTAPVLGAALRRGEGGGGQQHRFRPAAAVRRLGPRRARRRVRAVLRGGRCKPDPGIFLRACGMLGVDPERTLMVGDTPADAGAVAAGCGVLVLPCADAGRPNGLGAVLDLAGAA
ncbi:HAD family hydrolase [Micromonospora sp. BRA006-A]|nr:HAD family hydrolase [Micromonospora sp. BRA006-A]